MSIIPLARAPVTTASCFGFTLPEDIDFLSLRPGQGSPLRVTLDPECAREPEGTFMLGWNKEGRSIARLDGRDGIYRLWTTDVGWFRVEPAEPSITVSMMGGLRWETTLLGVPMALCMSYRGDMALHAAAVDVDGSALVFAAPGHHGKSTIAAGFLAAGYRMLSEDFSCVSLADGPSIIPGSSILRLRPDVHASISVPGVSVSIDEPGRVFLTVDKEKRGSADPVPLRGVVFLRNGDGDPQLERIPPERHIPDLFLLAFRTPTDADHARSFRAVTDLAARVPMWNFSRGMSFDRLPHDIERLVTTCLP